MEWCSFVRDRAATRAVLAWFLLVLAIAGVPTTGRTEEVLRVTLLGTGSPIPSPNRFSAATLVEAGDQKLLFDVGRGATIRLYQLGIPLGQVSTVFFTHYHSDHTVGLPDLWLSGWLPEPHARRTAPLRVIGPTGARELTDNLARAYAADIRIRVADQKLSTEGVTFQTEEFEREGVVYDQAGVRVIAIEVDHGDDIKPAFGYRVEYAGRSVVISGDTKFSENLVRHSRGADVIVHEVGAVRPEIANEPSIRLIMAHHTSPQEVGRTFSEARPRLGVYTHLVLLARPGFPPLTPEELIAQTRETYDGPLEVGSDLMRFEIREGGVTVQRPQAR